MLTWLMERSETLRGLVDFVYPPQCVGCGSYYDGEVPICPDCLKRIDWYTGPMALTPVDFKGTAEDRQRGPRAFPLYAAGDYTDPLKQIVIALKFKAVRGVVKPFVDYLVEQFGRDIQKLGPAILVPIPLHPSREHARGYNQAQLIAELLAERLEIPLVDELLVRVRKRRAQARLSVAKRATNIRGVFDLVEDCLDPEDCHRVILVDDVVTSGQTVFEARRVLSENGFQVVAAISLAHGR